MPPKSRKTSKATTPEPAPVTPQHQESTPATTTSPTAEITSILNILNMSKPSTPPRPSSRGTSYDPIEADGYDVDCDSVHEMPNTSQPTRRGGFFSSISGHKRTPLFKPNKSIQESMRGNPNFFQDAGVHLHRDMTPEELQEELNKCHDHARAVEQQKREKARVEKQIMDVRSRIMAYLQELPNDVIPDYMAIGIIGNLKRRDGETPVQHLARIKVVEMPIKKLVNKQNNQELNEVAQYTETMHILAEHMN